MPVRIRKTFQLFPGVKVNMSKGGISFTVGTKGYHLNFSKRGVRQTVGLPGSGISETSYIVKNDSKSESNSESSKSADSESKKSEHSSDEIAEERKQHTTHAHRTPAWLLLLAVIVIYLGAVLLGLIPTNFLSQMFHTLTEWTRGMGL